MKKKIKSTSKSATTTATTNIQGYACAHCLCSRSIETNLNINMKSIYYEFYLATDNWFNPIASLESDNTWNVYLFGFVLGICIKLVHFGSFTRLTLIFIISNANHNAMTYENNTISSHELSKLYHLLMHTLLIEKIWTHIHLVKKNRFAYIFLLTFVEKKERERESEWCDKGKKRINSSQNIYR